MSRTRLETLPLVALILLLAWSCGRAFVGLLRAIAHALQGRGNCRRSVRQGRGRRGRI